MKAEYFGARTPSREENVLQGRLIVLEGPDCIGRSTHIRLLQDWLERLGYGVTTTTLCQSELAEDGLRRAKKGNQIRRRTLALFYATDLADRLERQILPALESGFVVLADRYVYTIFARYAVRGVDPEWLRKAYGFALIPHLTMCLHLDLDRLVERALMAEKMGYWECGMDLNLADNPYDSFIVYQKRMIRQFSKITKEFNLTKVSAQGSVRSVQTRLRKKVRALLDLKETELDFGEPEGPVIEGLD
ncbi:MAG TPA: thymidylate kinase [Candidatus Hydrogenedentes bacterium]|nr:thymidylate kinase [Candidatus Hydrogenedentota bacterium]HIJ73452.1 thymidylate kinase [Candidatus Hydrogenedentota bacterium]